MSLEQVQVSLHPIGEPGNLFQTRAIGVLKGIFAPDGAITLTGGFHGKALTLGEKVHGLVQKLLKRRVYEALFVVYPQTKDGFVNRLQVIGVWKPSVLAPDSGAQDNLSEGENYFSIRGKVRYKVWCDDNYGRNVSVNVFGDYFVTVDFAEAPYLSVGDFVSMDAILTQDGRLYTERVEKILVSEATFARPRHGICPGRAVRRRSSAVN